MISKNGVALVIILLEAILSSLGVEFEAGTVTKAVEGFVSLVALVLLVWNQLDRDDVHWFVWKK